MRRKWIIVLIALSVFLSATFYIPGSAEKRTLPGIYTFSYRGNGGEYVETLGSDYTVSSLTGSVSLISLTTSSVVKLHEGKILLPLDIYKVVANGTYSFLISGYFDKKIVSGNVHITADRGFSYDIDAYYGVIYVYANYTGKDIKLTLKEGDRVIKEVSGSNGYAILTATTDIGSYKVLISSDGESDVKYTIAYTDRNEYVAEPRRVYKAKVVCIASCGLDGDTIRVKMGEQDVKVRLIGINTPEIEHGGNPAQCYGNEAKDFTDSHLNKRWVYLKFDNEVFDKYRRYLAYVWLSYPEMYPPDSDYMWNSVLAKEGYARVLSLMPNVTYAWVFSRLQYQAKKEGKGLWGACGD